MLRRYDTQYSSQLTSPSSSLFTLRQREMLWRTARWGVVSVIVLGMVVLTLSEEINKATSTSTKSPSSYAPKFVDFDDKTLVSRIAFGSCSNQSAPQPIWDAIIEFDPQVFIWMGDNVYGDNKRPSKILGKERTIGPWKNAARFYHSTKEELQRRYEIAKTNPGYVRLRQKSQVIGTWDDHDYGLNDAGKEFEQKKDNQRLLLDFLDEPQNSVRRKQAGVYASYMFGPKGKRVKVIVLDTRYHRDPLFSDGTILGESQWNWLENELNGPQSDITIIASSIQVVSNLSAVFEPLFYMESWGRFPKEKQRLFNLIDNSKREGIFFISGDVHFGEITRDECGAGYPLYDITSSGLTQSIEKAVPGPLAFLVRLIAWIAPSTMRVFSSDCRFRSCIYGQPNFGAIEIDWNATPPSVKLEIRDVNGEPAASVHFSLIDLQNQQFKNNTKNKRYLRQGYFRNYNHHCLPEVQLPFLVRYRLTFLLSAATVASVTTLVVLASTVVSTGKIFLKKFKVD
ncbi:hypothetical protein LUZ60_004596 [Juncus effusus]|nr:hypothetical protein LUZ60_004596 [Juncus effusus]